MTVTFRDFIAGLSAFNRKPGGVGIFSLVAGALIMMLFTAILPRPELYQPDSATYLAWSPQRTMGYPAFLSFWRLFDPHFALLPFLQMAAMVVATAALAEACHRLRPAGWLWSLGALAAFANIFLWRYAWMVMPEAIFISLCMLFVACFAVALRVQPGGLGWLALGSLALAIAILFRPVAYALLIAGLLATTLWCRPRIRAIAAYLSPLALVLLIASAGNWLVRGDFATQSFAGTVMAGQVAFLIDPPPDAPERGITAPIVETLAPVRAALPHRIADWSTYFWIASEGYNYALHKVVMPAVDAAVAEQAAVKGINLTEQQSQRRTNALAKKIALATIFEHPLAYARHVVITFVGLWTLPVILTAAQSAQLEKRLCTPGLSKVFCPAGHLAAVRVVAPSIIVVAKNTLLAALMLLTLVVIALAIGFGYRSPLLALLGLTALCIDGHHGLVSMLNAGLPRYAMAMWPLDCFFAAGCLIALTCIVKQRSVRALVPPAPRDAAPAGSGP